MEEFMDLSIIRIICGCLAVVLVTLIILRQRRLRGVSVSKSPIQELADRAVDRVNAQGLEPLGSQQDVKFF